MLQLHFDEYIYCIFEVVYISSVYLSNWHLYLDVTATSLFILAQQYFSGKSKQGMHLLIYYFAYEVVILIINLIY